MKVVNSRINKIVDVMKDHNLNQIIVSDPESIFYLLERKIFPLERVGVLLIKSNGEVHAFMNRILIFKPVEGVVLHEHDDGDNVYAEIASYLEPGTVGYDKNWNSGHTISVMKESKNTTPEIGSVVIDLARAVKDEAEKKALREAGAIDDEAVAYGIANISADLTEIELSNKIEKFFVDHGCDPTPYVQLVSYGETAADPHHWPDETKLKEGDAVLFDLFSRLNNYWCDMTRTVFYKSVTDHQREVYEVVRKAQQAAIDYVRPGIKMKEVDAAARKVIEDAGYGEYFITRTGHGIGMSEHELPFAAPDSEIIAEPGMCFSIEPGIYIPGDMGVRIEDCVLVTEDGCEVLTKYPKELQIIE